GIFIAAVAIAAIVWMTLRRERARKRYGLPVANRAMVAARILVPAVLIAVFTWMMNDQGGIPLPVIIMLAAAIAGHFITQHATFGRYLYAIGSNPDAAYLSGINA